MQINNEYKYILNDNWYFNNLREQVKTKEGYINNHITIEDFANYDYWGKWHLNGCIRILDIDSYDEFHSRGCKDYIDPGLEDN